MTDVQMSMTVGRLAAQGEVNIETIRYYEWRGRAARSSPFPFSPSRGGRASCSARNAQQEAHMMSIGKPALAIAATIVSAGMLCPLCVGGVAGAKSTAAAQVAAQLAKLTDYRATVLKESTGTVHRPGAA